MDVVFDCAGGGLPLPGCHGYVVFVSNVLGMTIL